ncbi:hypothetical protein H6P81_007180 [Aristolochia fimbriata]|uniref:Uncharacterized protein n=1 Tax=Aristolochia fimbriata TaxID=158543 RepID=A0AAV7F355_ARIFI|nr:hypothetical protein H6P81_007180 [Aristolochia fimbriata]
MLKAVASFSDFFCTETVGKSQSLKFFSSICAPSKTKMQTLADGGDDTESRGKESLQIGNTEKRRDRLSDDLQYATVDAYVTDSGTAQESRFSHVNKKSRGASCPFCGCFSFAKARGRWPIAKAEDRVVGGTFRYPFIQSCVE